MLSNIGRGSILYEKVEATMPGMYSRGLSYTYSRPIRVEAVILTIVTTRLDVQVLAKELRFLLHKSYISHEFEYLYDQTPSYSIDRRYNFNNVLGFRVRVEGAIPMSYLTKYKDEINHIELESKRVRENSHDFFSTAGARYDNAYRDFMIGYPYITHRLYSNLGIAEDELYVDAHCKTKVQEILFKPTSNKTAKKIAKLTNIRD